ncbi:MAG TPA: aldehyde dehydrogenase family protein, partial [Salinivirgaceae bacterium]|nr:aldehyde dehydrogenase family protein [Salinivirgaceae bacterium]
GPLAGNIIFNHPDFAGIHYTGSTEVFQSIWKQIVNNIEKYRSYPRIVGETGGKNFVLAHESANAREVSTAIVRGGFEYQGQKCSAASRVYLPLNRWSEIEQVLTEQLSKIKIGSVEKFTNFMNAVIDEKAFEKIVGYIERARRSSDCKIIYGGNYTKEQGYFIEPTVILTTNPLYETMREEIFGPVVTIYLYDAKKYNEVLDLIDRTAVYGLTGSLFARDRDVIVSTTHRLRHAAGNYYINDKPTGAVVGRQPFGGARGSGTNDKAGAALNLHRWLSPRTIKENFLPPTDFEYPFMQEG